MGQNSINIQIRTNRPSSGFTIVELLVVISIISMLGALLLTAVSSAREAGRRTMCSNNLRQVGLGAIHHLNLHGHFPTGGWGTRWAGDPDAGFGPDQPGGWLYNILPFIEEDNLHSMGRRATLSVKQSAGKERGETVVQIFYCPTRRGATTYPYDKKPPKDYVNIDNGPVKARSDYAGNAGDVECCGAAGPSDIEESKSKDYAWDGVVKKGTGLIYQRSKVAAQMVKDGLSKTYLAGEKKLTPDDYTNGQERGDDQGWDVGHDKDTLRWVASDNGAEMPPGQDGTPPAEIPQNAYFGSAHAATCNFVFADGSVRDIGYEIDEKLHRSLGNRKDGKAVTIPGD